MVWWGEKGEKTEEKGREKKGIKEKERREMKAERACGSVLVSISVEKGRKEGKNGGGKRKIKGKGEEREEGREEERDGSLTRRDSTK